MPLATASLAVFGCSWFRSLRTFPFDLQERGPGGKLLPELAEQKPKREQIIGIDFSFKLVFVY
jgi:hypothetical protein